MARKAQDLMKKPVGRPRKEIPPEETPIGSIADLKKEVAAPIISYNYHCCACGHNTDNPVYFPPSPSFIYSGNDNRLPICRSCINDLYTVFSNQYDNYHDVYRRICMLWDIYYDDAIADMAYKESDANHKMTKYIGKISRIIEYQRKTYADTIRKDVNERESSSFTGLSSDAKDVIKKKSIEFWGEGFSTEDYKFLDKTLKHWKEQVECDTPSKTALLKRICFNELQTRKALLNGDSTYKLTDELNKILDSAKLQPKQEKVEVMSDTHTLGTMIKKWEDDEGKPIPKVLPEFEDVDGIRKYLSVWFYGHLCKMIGRKNKWSKMYDEEIAKFTVTKPEYNSDDDDIDYESIFGAEE